MAYIGSAFYVYDSPDGQYRVNGVLYGFDDAVVVAWLPSTFLERAFARMPKMPPRLRELDELPTSRVTVEDVVSRAGEHSALVVPSDNIESARLAPSKFVGLLLGASVLTFVLRDDQRLPTLYAPSRSRIAVADLLTEVLGDRFDSRIYVPD